MTFQELTVAEKIALVLVKFSRHEDPVGLEREPVWRYPSSCPPEDMQSPIGLESNVNNLGDVTLPLHPKKCLRSLTAAALRWERVAVAVSLLTGANTQRRSACEQFDCAGSFKTFHQRELLWEEEALLRHVLTGPKTGSKRVPVRFW